MRKLLFTLLSLILVTGLILAIAQPAPDIGGGKKGGGSGVVTWDREDVWCSGLKRQKTHCHKGGNEQCTAKYCN